VAESALRQFKEANSVVDLGEESRNTVTALSDLDNSLTELRSKLADSTAQAADIQRNLNLNPQEAYAVGLVSESPGVQEVLVQLQTVQSQLAVAQTRYEETHPEIANIRSQENALLVLLDERIRSTLGSDQQALPQDDLQTGDLEKGLISDFLRLEAERAGLEQQVGELSGAQLTRQARAQILPSLEKQQRELERKLDAAQSTYETLLKNLQQAQVLENQNVGNARIVSSARVPKEPISPPAKLYLLAGGLIGLLLGTLATFLADLMDRSVKTVREGQDLYEYPLLGVIPAWSNLNASNSGDRDKPVIVVKDHYSVPVVESYQALQANLKFSSLDKPLKTVAVTSAVAKEGKSEVAANLAMTLAHLGSLVLVIDANMRSPDQHHIWEIAERKGLSNFVASQVALKDTIVKREPNLHVLPAGMIPPNPLAVLESKKMATLISACEKVYDYIIIDTPSLLGLADTLTIGKMTDGVLIVMQPGLADAESIKMAKMMLAQSQQRVLGVVANGIDVNSKNMSPARVKIPSSCQSMKKSMPMDASDSSSQKYSRNKCLI
jgi:polysaccharide biosynthesis transport protein